MKLKEGVSITGLKIEMRVVLIHANTIWRAKQQDLVITRGTEWVDNSVSGSLHPFGYALDFRSRYFTESEKKSAIMELSKIVGS